MLAGLVLTKDGKTLYVAAMFGHSLARFDSETGAKHEDITPDADSSPYGMAFDKSCKCLYVSLWSKAKVTVIDADKLQNVRQLPPEPHPDELPAREGHLL